MTHKNKEIQLFPLETTNILRNYKFLFEKFNKGKKKKKIKLAILSVSSTQHLKKIIELFLIYFGIDVIIYESQFGQYYEESVFPNNKLKKFNPDFIWINISNKMLPDNYEFDSTNLNVNLLKKKINEILSGLTEKYNSQIIINNLDYTPQKSSLKFYRSIKGQIDKIDKINNYIYSFTKNKNISLLDSNIISSNIGLHKWNSIKDWIQYKYHPSLESSVFLCFELCSKIKSF